MERPANVSEAGWTFLLKKIEEEPGPFLLAGGILERPDLLAGMTLSIPLEDVAVACFISEEAAKAIASEVSPVRLQRLGDKKEYFVPREIIIEALKGNIDYLEKIPDPRG